ncbi:hypothetical protein BGP77_08605 [Saccharospirillum sp. MSK14-1]|uniref:hypothetical protein n=1 Tax=Saccharospirillum sp. MSK14-1 TaxID=1897632 RepID=UPI000D369B39|nr:hypothetical protein [Saccharospirillum sp. MSK14-1]PTY35696.1 hypothetical protein BGP77_08605 [Saccharospirillum sp. MSK14-1]
MPIEPTGSLNNINPLNRQDTLNAPQTRVAEQTAATAQTPNQNAVQPDVQVDTSIDSRRAAIRSQVQEANELAVSQQDRGEVLEQLRGERERLAQGSDETENPTEQPERESLVNEDTFAALDRIRSLALEDPFGTGSADAGPLADNGFFVRSRQQAVDTLDQAISALERQTDLDTGRLEELRETFNDNQDATLSEGNTSFTDGDEASSAAAELALEIREQTPTDLFGLGEDDRETVLNALQP